MNAMKDTGEACDCDRQHTPFSAETILEIPPHTSKAEALHALVDVVVKGGRLPRETADRVTAALMERERRGTTGLGKGLALPHLRCREVTEIAGAIGVAGDGIDFNSLAGQPTRLILLVLSPVEQREAHAAIMARLAKLFSDRTLQYCVRLPHSPQELLRFLGL